jgi:hypothetical protein
MSRKAAKIAKKIEMKQGGKIIKDFFTADVYPFRALRLCVRPVFFDLIGFFCYDAINFSFPFLTFAPIRALA